MRIIKTAFLGNWGTTKEILKLLVNSKNFRVEFVLTQCDQKDTSDKWYSCVANYALENNIDVYDQKDFKKADDKLLDLIKKKEVELVISCAYPYLIKKDVIDWINNKEGIVNIHGSLLPKYRGVSPVVWSLINEEEYIGITLHYIDEGCDTGDIIYQSKIRNSQEDDLGTTIEKLKIKALKIFKKFMSDIINNKIVPRVSQRDDRATYAPRLKKKDLNISFSDSSQKAKLFYKATSILKPYIVYKDNIYYVVDLKVTNKKSETEPSVIVGINESQNMIFVSTTTFDVGVVIDSKNVSTFTIMDCINEKMVI